MSRLNSYTRERECWGSCDRRCAGTYIYNEITLVLWCLWYCVQVCYNLLYIEPCTTSDTYTPVLTWLQAYIPSIVHYIMVLVKWVHTSIVPRYTDKHTRQLILNTKFAFISIIPWYVFIIKSTILVVSRSHL